MAVAVVGSINEDLVVRVPRRPRGGETVLGSGHSTGAGGKGANQAVAAARLGSEVALVGRVGDDEPGRRMVAAMQAAGIDVTHVGVDSDARTGLAIITVDGEGENSIVVSPGANAGFLARHVDAARSVLVAANVTLLQLEIPTETAVRAAEITDGLLVLNPAPPRPLPAALLHRVDVLVPNRSELGVLAGVAEPRSFDRVVSAARSLEIDASVVVTLGASGAAVVSAEDAVHIPAPAVDAVDTTGAGDAFCGALAEALDRGVDLGASVRRAVRAGAIATTRVGAQGALPTAGAIESVEPSG